MFCKEDRCETQVTICPPIEIGGYNMIDVPGNLIRQRWIFYSDNSKKQCALMRSKGITAVFPF